MALTPDPRRAWRRLFRSAAVGREVSRHYRAAVAPPGYLSGGIASYRRYFRDRREYARLVAPVGLEVYDDNPQLRDWLPASPFDPHYTYQDAWAAREIYSRRPELHVDVGSRITFVIGVAAFVRSVFIDLRPLEVDIPNLETRAG